jgi:hypothetical protein
VQRAVQMRRCAATAAAGALAACLIATGAATAHGTAPPGPPPVTVSPLPGTPDASAATQISFLGPPGTTVSDVRVHGSRSGGHRGRLERYSTGTGESFLPARPFTPGETVTVSARAHTPAHSAATVATSFTVAVQAPVAQATFPPKGGDPAAVQHFLSAPALTPTTVDLTTTTAAAVAGDFFLAPYDGDSAAGPMIVDAAGRLIWFHQLGAGEAATDFRPERYDGQTVLTWWQGRILKLGFGEGTDEIYSSSYEPIAQVHAGNGYHADLHEFLLAANGTAWLDAFDPVERDLAALGGPAHGVVTDSVIQEIDVRTGLVMWEWHALGHVPLRDSYVPVPHTSHPWDFAHFNSIDPSHPGQLLLSSRNTWTVFDVSLRSGAVLWRLGGKQPSFEPGAGTVFRFQHDAAWQPGGLVSLFDNGYAVDRDTQSRGLVLDPNLTTHRVSLAKQFANPDATLLTSSQGDLLNLGGGSWLMGYGGLPNFTVYDASGHVLLNATLGPYVEDYRTYLAPWSGAPSTLPAIAAQAAPGGGVTVEASWNGATAVSSWLLLGGPTPTALAPLATAPAGGFETAIHSPASAPYLAVAAIGASGQTLAASAAIPAPSP